MAELETNVNEEVSAVDAEQETEKVDTAELARLRAEIAKQKAALDKATKEAAESKRALRARQTEEEAAAEEKRIADEERDKKLAEYEKRFTVAETSKGFMGFVGDEKTATKLAECFYGAADAETGIAELMKAWTAREKALKLEYGKIPAPGAGSYEGPSVSKAQLDSMSYTERAKFAEEHRDEYRRLMGR